jgi:hypothetical protein
MATVMFAEMEKINIKVAYTQMLKLYIKFQSRKFKEKDVNNFGSD